MTQEGGFEVEYILIDNVSMDKTLKISEEYRNRLHDSNAKRANGKASINVVSQKDSGMYVAINRGVSMTRGNILVWINADDYYPGDPR